MPIRKHSSRKLSGGRRSSGRKLSGGRRRRSGRKLSGGRRRRRSGRRLSGGKDCPKGKVLNPKTNRCITVGGKVYNALFGPDAKKPAAPQESAAKPTKKPKSSAKKPAKKPKKEPVKEQWGLVLLKNDYRPYLDPEYKCKRMFKTRDEQNKLHTKIGNLWRKIRKTDHHRAKKLYQELDDIRDGMVFGDRLILEVHGLYRSKSGCYLGRAFKKAVESEKDEDWDFLNNLLNYLYQQKFNLKRNDKYYIASASKQRNHPMEADVIESAFPTFVNLTDPYSKRSAALAAAQAYVDENGPDEKNYANLRFRQDDSPEREIGSYIDFLEL